VTLPLSTGSVPGSRGCGLGFDTRRAALSHVLWVERIRLLDYSALILAALMIGPHSSLSVRMRAANSPGAELLTSTPSGSNFDLIAGSASTVAASACIFLKMSGGVFVGASSPCQPDTSKPGTPSAIVGNSGAVSARSAKVTARPDLRLRDL
jgi:hypothetical protein